MKIMKKNLTTIIADNRLMADTIAKAIGAREYHGSFYSGKGYAVTWTGGTIIEATFKPDEKFVLNSKQDLRQVYAHHFSFAMRNYDELLGWNKSEEDAAQLETIKALWAKSAVVVNAMYPSFEGELAFLNLYWFVRQPVTVRRAWMPRLNKFAVIKGVTEGPRYPDKYIKWLESNLANHFIKADEESRGEKPEVNEVIPVEVKEGDTIKDGNIDFHITEGKHLYCALTLCLDAYDRLGFDIPTTRTLALTLYAKKLITFPMVLQNTVPESVTIAMEKNMRVLEYNSVWGEVAKKVKKLSRRNNYRYGESGFNGHGIVTTGLHPTDLTRDEEKLYNLIVGRVIEAFSPDVEGKGGKKKKKSKKNFKRRFPRKRKTA